MLLCAVQAKSQKISAVFARHNLIDDFDSWCVCRGCVHTHAHIHVCAVSAACRQRSRCAQRTWSSACHARWLPVLEQRH